MSSMAVKCILYIVFHLIVCPYSTYADQQTLFKKLHNYGNIWKSKMQTEVAANTSAGACAIFCAKSQCDIFAMNEVKKMCYYGRMDETSHPLEIKTGQYDVYYCITDNYWTKFDDYYNEAFPLSSYIWTEYTFDTYPLNGLQNATECGVICELSVDQCDFFTTDMGHRQCHLGRYNHSDLGEVVGSNVAMTYHNQDKIEWVKEDNFRWWSSGKYWYKWIYKIEQRPTIWKCFLECFHDDECDYFVDVNNHCCYGDFQYNGTATTWTDDVTVYVKNGRQPNTSYISTYFHDAYGNATKPNSVLGWWPYGIWANYDNVENSEQCAFRCYIRKVEDCAFYYWGSGCCHLGNFNTYYSNKLVGDYDEDTKYQIRKDFDFAVWSEYYNSGTNDGDCQNHGYRQLNNNGDHIDITSGGHSYDDNERCYWGIYAPGAQKLEFQLTSDLRVSSWYDTDKGITRDFLNVYLGVGNGAYLVLRFKSSHNEECCWEYEAELMSLFWSTNSNGVDYGFDARITRIG